MVYAVFVTWDLPFGPGGRQLADRDFAERELQRFCSGGRPEPACEG